MKLVFAQSSHVRLRFRCWLAALIILAALPVGQIQAVPALAPVSPAVLADAADGQADFLVEMKGQAILDQAALAGKKSSEKRQAVYQALIAASARSQASLTTRLAAMGLNYRAYWLVNAVAVRGDAALIARLRALPEVDRIESNQPYKVDLPEPESGRGVQSPTAVEWNIAKIGAPQVWALGKTGQGIVYASGDTGVQWDHPALKDQYRGWDGMAADHNYNWWNSTVADTPDCYNSPCDDHGHGTHVMGIGIGSDGGLNQIGVAPGARWISCRNMKAGVGTPSTYIGCLEFFLAPTDLAGANARPELGADVVSNSYGCTLSEGCPSALLETAVNNMRIAGIFMAVSAGNSVPGCSTVNDPPGTYASSFSVGSTDSNDLISPFSSRGPVGDLLKPDLVAPGSSVKSSVPGGGYGYKSGTSMSAPHVAGAVALLWSARPELRGLVGLTETVLRKSALPLSTTELCGGTAGLIPNNVYGSGRLDIAAAMDIPVFIHFLPLIFR